MAGTGRVVKLMKNFGKFIPSHEIVTIAQPPLTLLDEEGGEVVVAPPPLSVSVTIFRNPDGQNLLDMLKGEPHPFYIAVDEGGVIVSISDDPEKIQLDGHDIIGIDADMGITPDEMETALGKIWNGTAIVAPPVPLPPLTARQFWQAALVLGITEDGLVASVSDPEDALYIEDENERLSVLVDIRKSTSFRRDYPLIDEMATAHDLPKEQMDDLWAWAAQIE